MEKIKGFYLLMLILVLIFFQILLFNLIIKDSLRESGEVFTSFLSNLFKYDNFVVSKLDEKFNDFNLNQNFSSILKEGSNDYIQGIYYPSNTLKYVKKVYDGYLLYEIPEDLIEPQQSANKIYLVAVNNKIIFSNRSSLLGSNLSDIKLFSVIFETKQGFKVILGMPIVKVILFDFLFSLPLVLLFVVFYYLIFKKYSKKHEKMITSINEVVKRLDEANQSLIENGKFECCKYDVSIPELVPLKTVLENIENNFSKIIEKQRNIAKEYKKAIDELEIVHEVLVNKDLQLITALAETVELKDSVTGNHSKKVVDLALEIAKILGVNDKDEIEAIMYGAILHDIGKIGIPESILNKPSKLTPEEFEIMKKHTILGEKIIQSIPGWDLVADIIRHHHENYDGSGYPDGLSGDEISLRAQIVSIADVFTALTENRPYRKALSIDEAIEVIRGMVGTKFSEEIFNAFLKALDRLLNGVDKG